MTNASQRSPGATTVASSTRRPGSRGPGRRGPGRRGPGWRDPGWRNPGWRNPGWKNTAWQLLAAVAGCGLWWGLSSGPAAAAGSAPEEVETVAVQPAEGYSEISEEILERLDAEHYRDVVLDDGMSERLFERYLARLDPWRGYFLASDIEEFAPWRDRLDDFLRVGDFEPAYAIFNRLQERRLERFELLQNLLEERLDELTFDTDEVLPVDRGDAAWPASHEEANDLWRRRFENDVLALRLADRSADEIESVLDRRYSNQLRRLSQVTSDEVFALYMGVVTGTYDPHTQYMPPRDAENFDISMSLSLEGIGALLGNDGEYCEIVRVIPGGPAEKSGMLSAGDRIAAVAQDRDGQSVNIVGWRTTEAVELIRGPKGSIVRLEILPSGLPAGGTTREVEIVRDEVKLEEQAARSEIVEVEQAGRTYRMGVIVLPAFYVDFEAARAGDPNFRSSTRDVANLLFDLQQQDIDGIVMDLRDNGGGSLVEARTLTGLFLGREPVVQVRGPGGRVEVAYTRQRRALYDGPLAVLVNRLSASASEIFAGAVQDTGRGVVVGTRTFGKGTVQNLAPLAGGQLKLTQAKFYRVSGASTQHLGVVPDVLLPATYDPEEIGESALEDALPWDSIEPVEHGKSDVVRATRERLQALHEARLGADPELAAIVRRLAIFDEQSSRTVLQLNEEQRRVERDVLEGRLLEIENQRREASGDELIASLDEIGPRPLDEVDALAREAARVLTDLVVVQDPDTPR